MVIINTILLLVGLFLLVKGSDILVKSAASIAKRFGVSEFLIGLSLVALGTSIPELGSSIIATLANQTEIVVGNILGSNLANIGLVLGLSGIFGVIYCKKRMLKRDGYIMLLATALFFVAGWNGKISRLEALTFFFFYIAYMTFLFQSRKKAIYGPHFRGFIRYFFSFRYIITIRSKILVGIQKRKLDKLTSTQKRKLRDIISAETFKDTVWILVSGTSVVIGANLVVSETLFLANLLKISTTLMGASVIAIGTSLPELSISVSAIRKGFGNIAVGNIIGSNIANIFLVGGISGLISPLIVTTRALLYLTPFVFIISLVLLGFLRSDWRINRPESVTLLILYIILLAFTISAG